MNRRTTLKVHAETPWELIGGFYQAPATLLVESVACGSGGCLKWEAGVILNMARHWHDIPLTVDHPERDGHPVSVNSGTAIHNAYVVGKVVNPKYCHTARGLKATLKIHRDHPRRKEAMGIREISVGVFTEDIPESGVFRGKRYVGKVVSARPDHCALVDKGACDWETGCGVRVNSELDELRTLAGRAIAHWTNSIIKGESTMANHEHMAVLPPEVYEASREQDELQLLKEWENYEGHVPPEIIALRLKHAAKQQRPGSGHESQAVYPIGVE